MEDPIKTSDSRVAYQNQWITIHEDTTIKSDGSDGLYGYLESNDSVCIVVVDQQEGIYLQRSFRYPTKSWGWELPGGSSDGEGVQTASRRELREETGIEAEQIDILGYTLVCNGLMTERQYTCIASGLKLGGARTETEEAVNGARFFTPNEIDDMIESGEIDDNQTLTGLYLAQRIQKKRRRNV